jgi:DmsE family decaheme c-type cytochrome
METSSVQRPWPLSFSGPPKAALSGSQPTAPPSLTPGTIAAILFFTLFAVSPAAAQPAAPVGAEVCQTCHEEIVKKFTSSRHTSTSCESCHGSAAKHAESAEPADIKNPRKLAVAAADTTCRSCHSKVMRNEHSRFQISCVGCHTVHQSAEALRPRRPAAVNAQCTTCHTSSWAEFQRPHAHRLKDGAMSCADCHNLHSSVLPRNVRTVTSNEPGCLKCHGDKRGPFAFEHAPVRLDGCAACHQPHGSANPRMLTRAEVRFQCLECHSNTSAASPTLGGSPTAFHDLRSPRYRNCTTCHIKIHGSHINEAFLR